MRPCWHRLARCRRAVEFLFLLFNNFQHKKGLQYVQESCVDSVAKNCAVVVQSLPSVDSLSDETGAHHVEDTQRQVWLVHCSVVVAGSPAVFSTHVVASEGRHTRIKPVQLGSVLPDPAGLGCSILSGKKSVHSMID